MLLITEMKYYHLQRPLTTLFKYTPKDDDYFACIYAFIFPAMAAGLESAVKTVR